MLSALCGHFDTNGNALVVNSTAFARVDDPSTTSALVVATDAVVLGRLAFQAEATASGLEFEFHHQQRAVVHWLKVLENALQFADRADIRFVEDDARKGYEAATELIRMARNRFRMLRNLLEPTKGTKSGSDIKNSIVDVVVDSARLVRRAALALRKAADLCEAETDPKKWLDIIGSPDRDKLLADAVSALDDFKTAVVLAKRSAAVSGYEEVNDGRGDAKHEPFLSVCLASRSAFFAFLQLLTLAPKDCSPS